MCSCVLYVSSIVFVCVFMFDICVCVDFIYFMSMFYVCAFVCMSVCVCFCARLIYVCVSVYVSMGV